MAFTEDPNSNNTADDNLPVAKRMKETVTNNNVTNNNNDDNDDNYEKIQKIQKRFIEDRRLLASQSIPTTVTPYVMKTTTKLPDSERMKILVTGTFQNLSNEMKWNEIKVRPQSKSYIQCFFTYFLVCLSFLF